MSPNTSLFVPSNALIIMELWRTPDGSTGSLTRVALGKTLSAEPLSIRTLATKHPLHLTVTCRALVCFKPAGPISSSEKVTKLDA